MMNDELQMTNGTLPESRAWRYALPPIRHSKFSIRRSPAWVQHFIHHLAPQGMAGFVLANGSMSSNQSGDCNARSARRKRATNWQGLGSQRDIRRALIEADLVDCMVALPGQLFYSTQIPVCLWFLAKNKAADAKRGFRDRRPPASCTQRAENN
jgi:type I restriction enzyme M protein